ncbi:tRNA 2-thiouridine(34) synthase MnmA, partial [Patescibacteria group bacterium]|nr:tRNA 2-thiouridine(34) synthase MnmA [Patescibacteria group bacterium]
MTKTEKKSVLVGMSGGVDSSVSAALLKERGFRVVGGFIKNWSDTKDVWTGECDWYGERRDAMRVAAKLGIPLLTFDFEEQYRDKVVKELFAGYEAGETPNPDVLCNEAIKFGLFLDEARRLGFDYIATGHYAQVVSDEDGVAHLMRGADSDKDQSYFLYRVPQKALQQSIFPIGDLTKDEVRKIAQKLEHPVAEKPDSQGICFIGKLDMGE